MSPRFSKVLATLALSVMLVAGLVVFFAPRSIDSIVPNPLDKPDDAPPKKHKPADEPISLPLPADDFRDFLFTDVGPALVIFRVGDGNRAVLVDLEARKALGGFDLQAPGIAPTFRDVSPDGAKLLVRTTASEMGIWSLPDGATLLPFRPGAKLIADCFFLDAKTIVVAEPFGEVTLYDLGTRRPIASLPTPKLTMPTALSRRSGLAHSPDRRYLAQFTRDRLRILDLRERKVLVEMPPLAPIGKTPLQARGTAFSPDGQRVAVLIDDSRTVHVYDALTGVEQTKWPIPESVKSPLTGSTLAWVNSSHVGVVIGNGRELIVLGDDGSSSRKVDFGARPFEHFATWKGRYWHIEPAASGCLLKSHGASQER